MDKETIDPSTHSTESLKIRSGKKAGAIYNTI